MSNIFAHICGEERVIPGLLCMAQSHDEHVAAFFHRHRLVFTIIVTESLRIAGSEIMYAILVGILTSCLVLEETRKKIFSERWVEIQKGRPCWVNHVHCIDIAVTRDLCILVSRGPLRLSS